MKIPSWVRWVLIILVIFIVVEGVSFYHSLNYWHHPSETTPSASQNIRTWTLPDTGQHPNALSQWNRPYLLVNFWATWCGPCQQEIPLLNQISNDQVQVLGIALDTSSAVQAFVQKHPLHYPILLGSDEELNWTKTYGNEQKGLPFTAIIDAHGKIIYAHLGQLHQDDLNQALSTLSPALRS